MKTVALTVFPACRVANEAFGMEEVFEALSEAIHAHCRVDKVGALVVSGDEMG